MAERSGKPAGGIPTVFEGDHSAIKMKAQRPARANEEMTCILSYRNLAQVTTDGRLHLFLNEKKYPKAHFALDSARTCFGENPDASYSAVEPAPTGDRFTAVAPPSSAGRTSGSASAAFLDADAPPSVILENMLRQARTTYRQENAWRFNNLKPGESRNTFLSLRGTENMLRDTNAMIHLEAVFAPFDPMLAPERFELEIEIVSSHDPNAIIVSDSRVNYRFIGNKKLDYKVKFQNNGEGPASTVELLIEIPEGLDRQQMQPLEWYPMCPICPPAREGGSCLDTASSKNGLSFTFRNIYLPGSRQKGVSQRDSTQGFVRYRLNPERDMPKRPFRSRAKITFDKNPPIYTNFTRTRFAIGLSPGLKAGYGFEPDFGSEPATGENRPLPFVKDGYAFLGISLAPYKPWRWHPQIELLTGIKGQSASPETHFTSTIKVPDSNPDLDTFIVRAITEQRSSGFFSLEIPVTMRKNINQFVGIGAGGSCRVIFENGRTIQNITENKQIFLTLPPPEPPVLLAETPPETYSTDTQDRATRFRYAAFGDLTLGSVRKGLNLGIRGGWVFGKNRNAAPFAQVSLEMKL
jgi:hypothetical protein